MSMKPILFNTDMVRAILDGRKNCTRRIVKPQQLAGLLPDKCKNGEPEEFLKEKKFMFKPYCDMTDIELINTAYKTPYQPGDILYVRETWERFDCCSCEGDSQGNCPKEPSRNVIDKRGHGCYMYRATDEIYGDARWHPSIHMPKDATRIFLRVTNVRVERLRDITVEDTLAEGMDKYIRLNGELDENSIITSFIGVWNSTIKKSDLDRYGWDANPWVWVIEFERCEKPELLESEE